MENTMQGYLKKEVKKKDTIDCVLTNNYDEGYFKIYPKITKKMLFDAAVNYPDCSYKKLESLICKKFGIRCCVLGSGSENLIIQINKFLSKKTSVGVVSPVFYRIIETIGNVLMVTVKEEDLFRNSFKKNIDALWIQNPNLFTSKTYDKNLLLDIVDKNKNILFIIDEAGIFILSDWKKYSLLSEANKRKNLIVIESFSKVFGISGLRAGFATGPKEVIRAVKKDNLTFPISSITIKFIENILGKTSFITEVRKRIKKNKKEIESLLLKNNTISVIKSKTNCIFFKHSKINIHKELLRKKILTLNLDSFLEEKGFVRMTVHSSERINEEIKKRIKSIFIN